MQEVQDVLAIAGAGLKGDRYATGKGSHQKRKIGVRQVILMNARIFNNVNRLRGNLPQFKWTDCRRNIFTEGVELMWLIDREFRIGKAKFRGAKYCDPCERPSKLSGIPGFKEAFEDCGGLVAEILEGGMIRVGDAIIPPPKGY